MGKVVNLGVFVADTAYRAARQPKMGETILGRSFVLGPGGKGSNQSVASAMAGAVGAGGLGDVAIRYGYQRFDTTVMLVVIAILILLVSAVQFGGDYAVRRLKAR